MTIENVLRREDHFQERGPSFMERASQFVGQVCKPSSDHANAPQTPRSTASSRATPRSGIWQNNGADSREEAKRKVIAGIIAAVFFVLSLYWIEPGWRERSPLRWPHAAAANLRTSPVTVPDHERLRTGSSRAHAESPLPPPPPLPLPPEDRPSPEDQFASDDRDMREEIARLEQDEAGLVTKQHALVTAVASNLAKASLLKATEEGQTRGPTEGQHLAVLASRKQQLKRGPNVATGGAEAGDCVCVCVCVCVRACPAHASMCS
jgi:hypothetical protein